MRIISLKKICPGRRHAWYETDLGFDVRKPIGQKLNFLSDIFKVNTPFELKEVKVNIEKKSWFRRLIEWIKCKF